MGLQLNTFLKPKLNTVQLSLLTSLYLVLFGNSSFWHEIFRINADAFHNIFFVMSIFVFLVLFINACLTLISFTYLLKPASVVILLTASLATYFMNSYGIVVDRSMVQNVWGTDVREASELFNMRILYYFILLGLLPSFLIFRTKIKYASFLKHFSISLVVLLVNVVLLTAVVFPFYKDYISLGKNYKYVRHIINPVNYIYAFSSYGKRALASGKVIIKPVGQDAVLAVSPEERGKKNLVIFVVGEAARAVNFSLNGYERDTNPLLSNEDIINFSNTYSCGTSTAHSVPCMFSPFDRESCSVAKAHASENVLDVLSHAGINVLWRDNNSGCKGACDRVETDNVMHLHVEDVCNDDECFDMVLLHGLQEYVDGSENDTFIVLHQKGSHGPAYYLRSPETFKRFLPECRTNQLQDCTREEVVNAYDNTILYTDYFLDQVIAFLKKNSEKYNTAMMYMSDHGQSLGENNIYLHGLPYWIAPDEQKHIPFIVWLSPELEEQLRFDRTWLENHVDEAYSHDNLFHSVLGLMGVTTEVYDEKPDIFSGDMSNKNGER